MVAAPGISGSRKLRFFSAFNCPACRQGPPSYRTSTLRDAPASSSARSSSLKALLARASLNKVPKLRGALERLLHSPLGDARGSPASHSPRPTPAGTARLPSRIPGPGRRPPGTTGLSWYQKANRWLAQGSLPEKHSISCRPSRPQRFGTAAVPAPGRSLGARPCVGPPRSGTGRTASPRHCQASPTALFSTPRLALPITWKLEGLLPYTL